jgi:hypothetical protein
MQGDDGFVIRIPRPHYRTGCAAAHKRKIMDIVEATRSYEAWLGAKVDVVKPELTRKHAIMRDSAFQFLRATFYRWIELWPALCQKSDGAPHVLSVGDLHVENFGTWRDAEARLIWGVNDFDEAHPAPYTNDLVRLATSILIAIAEAQLDVDGKKACAAILAGYAKAMKKDDGEPFVLEESHHQLRAIATSDERSPEKYWDKLASEKHVRPPRKAETLLRDHLPRHIRHVRYVARVAGIGSLGLPRYAAYGDEGGGLIGREAKRRVPSAHAWAGSTKALAGNYRAILANAVRMPDPLIWVQNDWLIRRLAPHCESMALADIGSAKALRHVLKAMGAETANIHRGGRAALPRIRKHLAARKDSWLYDDARAMADATVADWKAWKKRTG